MIMMMIYRILFIAKWIEPSGHLTQFYSDFIVIV